MEYNTDNNNRARLILLTMHSSNNLATQQQFINSVAGINFLSARKSMSERGFACIHPMRQNNFTTECWNPFMSIYMSVALILHAMVLLGYYPQTSFNIAPNICIDVHPISVLSYSRRLHFGNSCMNCVALFSTIYSSDTLNIVLFDGLKY